jgi:GTP-binding protein
MEAAWATLAALPRPAAPDTEPELIVAAPPTEEPLAVEVTENGAFRVQGTAAERAAARAYMQSREGLAAFHEALRRLGVLDALKAAGAEDGDTVLLGKTEFDYVADDREPSAPRRRTARERKQARGGGQGT